MAAAGIPGAENEDFAFVHGSNVSIMNEALWLMEVSLDMREQLDGSLHCFIR